ncbi:MAG: zinc-binding dehydrogenase [Acidimicrobiales bacterium]|nr:zinc-binding dehydrogenase [Acidimicrobiales bacterium]
MRAAVGRAFGQPLQVEWVQLAPPGPDDVQVDLDACAICHSDISYMDGAWGGDLPAVWGHEAAGVVSAVGADVTRANVGDRVVVSLIRSCGTCTQCQRGNEVGCTTEFALDVDSPLRDGTGAPIDHGLRTAGFAGATTVHQSQVVPIPAQMGADVASLLACGVITGVGAVTNTAAVRAGSSVAVVGTGGVGLNTVQGARLAGADPIIALDIDEAKLAAARDFGATDTVNVDTDDVEAVIAQLTDGDMVEYVFVTTGAKSALEDAGNLVGPGGALVLVGMPPSDVSVELDPGSLAAANQRILGSKMGSCRLDRDVPRLIKLYQNGDLELDALITNRYPLDRINEAIDEVRAGTARRNIIEFNGNDR